MRLENPLLRSVVRVFVVAALLLSVPFLAMFFNDEVNWTLFDFTFMGALILGIGLTYELTVHRFSSHLYKMAIGLSLAGLFLLVWINGAVGIIGSEDNLANGLYLGVFLTIFLGSIISRFRPSGMEKTLMGTAIIQALITAGVLVFQLTPRDGAINTLFLNLSFLVIFFAAARLFRAAQRESSRVQIGSDANHQVPLNHS